MQIFSAYNFMYGIVKTKCYNKKTKKVSVTWNSTCDTFS